MQLFGPWTATEGSWTEMQIKNPKPYEPQHLDDPKRMIQAHQDHGTCGKGGCQVRKQKEYPMYIWTSAGFIRGYSLMDGGTMLGQALATDKHRGLTSTVDIPVLHLTQIQRNKYIGAFTRKPSGFK